MNGRRTHGLSKHPLHRHWVVMRFRCRNPNSVDYPNYGGRGIKICSRWDHFENFFEDMLETYQEGLQIDRVDNEGNYEPGNCVWTTIKENSRHRRSSKLTMEDAEEIRTIRATTVFSHQEIGELFGVSSNMSSAICRGERWV